MTAARFKRTAKGKRSHKKNKPRFYFVLTIIILGVLTSPLLWHLSRISRARDDYNFNSVATEIAWVDRYAPILNKWDSFKDEKLWLRLNTGPSTGLEEELSRYEDDRHRFWLVQMLLQDGNTQQATEVSARISSESTRTLAYGLIALAQRDVHKAREMLYGLTGLNEKEETLKRLALVQIYISLDDLAQAEAELKNVIETNPNHPAAKMMEFNLALAEREWSKAIDLSSELDKTIRPTPVYLVQKGLLQLRNQTLDQEIITRLGTFPQGRSYVNYLLAIKELNQGHLTEGKTLLEQALSQGLPGELYTDAVNSLQHTNDRLRAEESLKIIVSGNGI